jgi:hypothetical protein
MGFSAGPALAAPPCFTPEETAAVQLRQFHLRLQVAALKCDDPAWGIRDRYNGYVSKFGKTLSSNAHSLRAALKRTGLAQTETQFDRYITRLANDISLAAPSSVEYCQNHRSLLDEALAVPPGGLSGLAAVHETAPAQSCSVARVAEKRK